MTTPPHADTAVPGDHHAADDHGDDGGHADHAHDGGPALGPIDVPAWSAGVVGVALGLIVVLGFVLATAPPV